MNTYLLCRSSVLQVRRRGGENGPVFDPPEDLNMDERNLDLFIELRRLHLFNATTIEAHLNALTARHPARSRIESETIPWLQGTIWGDESDVLRLTRARRAAYPNESRDDRRRAVLQGLDNEAMGNSTLSRCVWRRLLGD